MSAKYARAVPVLMYHHVSTSPGMITVTPDNFAAQMDYLARAGYRTIGAAQLAGFLSGEDVPAKSLVITFDDGYLDNWVHAHPVLKRHDFTALCFLVSSWPGEGGVRPNASDNLATMPRLLDHRAGERAIENGYADDVILRWSKSKRCVKPARSNFIAIRILMCAGIRLRVRATRNARRCRTI